MTVWPVIGPDGLAQRITLSAGETCVMMIASNKNGLKKLARGTLFPNAHPSFARTARRLLRLCEREGIQVAWLGRECRRDEEEVKP